MISTALRTAPLVEQTPRIVLNVTAVLNWILPEGVTYDVATETGVALNVTGEPRAVEIIDAVGNENVEGVIAVGVHAIGPWNGGANERVLVPGGVAKKKLLQSFAPVAVIVPEPLIFIATGVGVPPTHGLSAAEMLTVSVPEAPPLVRPGENDITPDQ